MSVFGKRKAERPGPSEGLKRWLLEGEHIPPGGEDHEAYFADYFTHPGSVWRQHRDALLAEWIAERAGTRPAAWWTHDLPRGAARLKLGGTGAESCAWSQSDALWTYFDADPKNPPHVESIPSFLRRIGAMEPAEAKRIPAKDWKPVKLKVQAGWSPPLDGSAGADAGTAEER